MALFQTLRDAWDRRRALRELKGFESNDKEARYWAFNNAMFEINEMIKRDHFQAALQRWEAAYAQYPEQALQSEPSFKILFELKQFTRIDQLATLGQKQNAANPMHAEARATAALELFRHEEALETAMTLVKRYPFREGGYFTAGAALRKLGRPKEAEEILTRAIATIPDSAGLIFEYIRLAESEQRWDTVLEQSKKLAERFKPPFGVSTAMRALCQLGRFQEADEFFESMRYLCGNDTGVWLAYAGIEESQENWTEAARRWEDVRKRFPRQTYGYMFALPVLKRLGQTAAIEAVLREGMDQIPESREISTELGRLLNDQQRWTEAADLWQGFRSDFPAFQEGISLEAAALKALGREPEASALLADYAGGSLGSGAT